MHNPQTGFNWKGNRNPFLNQRLHYHPPIFGNQGTFPANEAPPRGHRVPVSTTFFRCSRSNCTCCPASLHCENLLSGNGHELYCPSCQDTLEDEADKRALILYQSPVFCPVRYHRSVSWELKHTTYYYDTYLDDLHQRISEREEEEEALRAAAHAASQAQREAKRAADAKKKAEKAELLALQAENAKSEFNLRKRKRREDDDDEHQPGAAKQAAI